MGIEVSFLAAMLAGVLSVSSPCVLPLVPIYLAHLAGASSGLDCGFERRRVLPSAVDLISIGVALGAAGALVSSATVVSSNRE